MAAYRRILLKLSGEALAGGRGFGLDPAAIDTLCGEIREVHAQGVEIAIVVGGGNIFRGLAASAEGMDRVTGDHMGMLATMINGMALQEAFEKLGVPVHHMTAKPVGDMAEPFNHRAAIHHLDSGAIVVFSGGTGNPYFSTDTAASLRAAQVKADAILKGTKVDGVYEGDPVKDASFRRFDTITFSEVLERGLRVMDASAIAMCRDIGMPIVVFNMTEPGTLLRVVNGDPVGTIVKEDANG